MWGKSNWLCGMAVSLFLFCAMVLGPRPIHGSEPEDGCDIHRGPCSQTMGGTKVSLEITPRPVRVMRELHFKVEVHGRNPSGPPFIDLDMPGMYMGPNIVRLKASSPNSYEGWGLIVRCMSGRTDWHAEVCLPGIGKADFFFNVVNE